MWINKKLYDTKIQKDALCKIDNYYNILEISYKKTTGIKAFFQYNDEVKFLFEKYNTVKLITIEFHAFGEALARCFALYKNIKQNELYVVLPYFYEKYRGNLPNKRIFDLFGDQILFINEINIDFWNHVIANYFDKFDLSNYDMYAYRKAENTYIKMGEVLVDFTNNIKKEAEEKVSHLPIKEPFVCIHVRDRGCTKLYLNKSESEIRESNINTLKKTCKELLNLKIQPVRMGKFEEKTLAISGVIDYAGLYQDDLLDFYLISKCKFMIGTNSGLSVCSAYFGRPLLRVNAMGDNFLYEMLAITNYDMFIPKKLWSKKEKRYLNFKECLDMHEYCMLYTANYRVNGIIIEDNTENEIWEAVSEMNSKIDGTWVTTEDEKECNRKYNELIENWVNERTSIKKRRLQRWRGFTMPAIPICYSYLKKNKYLLEDF